MENKFKYLIEIQTKEDFDWKSYIESQVENAKVTIIKDFQEKKTKMEKLKVVMEYDKKGVVSVKRENETETEVIIVSEDTTLKEIIDDFQKWKKVRKARAEREKVRANKKS